MTLADFYKLRQTKDCPRDVVIWLDDTMIAPLDNHIVVGKAQMRELDVRYFLGMEVFIYTDKYSQWLLDVLEQLKKTAAFILVGLTDFGDDLGWTWTKQTGEQAV